LAQESHKNIKISIYGDFSKISCQVLFVVPADPVLDEFLDIVPELVNL
jgi:hypothetical protein